MPAPEAMPQKRSFGVNLVNKVIARTIAPDMTDMVSRNRQCIATPVSIAAIRRAKFRRVEITTHRPFGQRWLRRSRQREKLSRAHRTGDAVQRGRDGQQPAAARPTPKRDTALE